MKRKAHKRGLRLFAAAFIIITAALLLLGRYGLCVTEYEYRSAKLSDGFAGFRIVQLSDLHGRGEKRLLRAVREQNPDIIVITGDIVTSGKAEEQLPAVEPLLEGLSALAPVYFVSGNHDWAAHALPQLEDIFERCGIVYLRNESVLVSRGEESLVLAGVEDPNGPADMPAPDEFAQGLRELYPDSFTLLLAHRNYWAEEYPQLPVDLILCGHAHGGIVRLPLLGGLLSTGGHFFPEYESGLYELPSYSLIVSRGLGNSVPIPRFLNTPEIVTITLQK